MAVDVPVEIGDHAGSDDNWCGTPFESAKVKSGAMSPMPGPTGPAPCEVLGNTRAIITAKVAASAPNAKDNR